ncbi:MAG TPA: hypothetical protein VF817_00345, partial [Patescibacteria group bacterium]
VGTMLQFVEFGHHKITSFLRGDFIVTQELRSKRTHQLTLVVYRVNKKNSSGEEFFHQAFCNLKTICSGS